MTTTIAIPTATAAAESDLTGLAAWAVDVMETLGAPGAGLAIALENLFPPLPSEVILPLAGFTASQGSFTLAEVLFWTTLGSVVGALALYAVGAMLGRERTRAVAKAMPLVDVADVDRTEAWFRRHGRAAVFFGRMIPLFRSLISVPAGVTRMRLTLFLLLTTVGSAIWNTAFVLAGFALGESWHLVEPWADAFQLVVIVAAVLAVGAFVVRRVVRMREHRRRVGRGEATEGGL
ncbi:membrane protein DedA with SNARE-associated domain [Agromyces flavus]|uniref:Membrane protein DedA with SNARE-associated domain n=1 Tax=Agromyces flavus TaxID=589382 RepID=A0A1H1M506_9MICO|nr:DedA family protein [Agromyces flavus]MCP2368702.1 membrane protein DedA with SNARE-associated domain [Agromyces flavus]GGI48059.1 DedA family protein [Agromyces flavus]SDR81119.1 membrane protein DedA, SNARE-associated domain [Agromyces flavus]